MTVSEDVLYERTILLVRMFSDYSNILLKIGKEIQDEYCLNFNDEGYDSKYARVDNKKVLQRVASRLTDQQLIQYAEKYKMAYDYSQPFTGKYYTYNQKTRELKLSSSWDNLKNRLDKLFDKHGRSLLVVLEACYETNLSSSWDNYLKIQYHAKDKNVKGWRHVLTDLESDGIVWRHKGDVKIPEELMPLVKDIIDKWKLDLSSMLEISGKDKVALADILYDYFLVEDSMYGNRYISPLPEEIHSYFGRVIIRYHPVNPQKSIRDFVDGTEESELLPFLTSLTRKHPKLEDPLNGMLSRYGVKLKDGKVISSTEIELKLVEEEKPFLSKLDSLGFGGQAKLLSEGMDYLREGKVQEASSKITLAFDSIFKQMLSKITNIEINTRESMGKLIDHAISTGLIEQAAQTSFRGFVALRNLDPQHAGLKGEVDRLSPSLAFLLAHSGRTLIGYLIERFDKRKNNCS